MNSTTNPTNQTLTHIRELELMRKYRFILDSGDIQHVIARDFREACLSWARFGLDPREIAAMECYA